ncbi:MAG: glycogen debranching enzyme GlgX, partial [Variovorax sp.]
DNRSWNCGVEGPTDDEAVLALRARQQRNLLATLLLSQGTPMLLAGDEFGRTQQGNNNAYCQDDDISWVDWQKAGEERGRALTQFVQHITHLRRTLPVLRRNRFLTGQFSAAAGVKDATWLAPDGAEMDHAHWQDPQTRCFGLLLEGTAPGSSLPQPAADASVLLVFNAWEGAIDFKLPPRGKSRGKVWTRMVDTALEAQAEDTFKPGHHYTVTGRSLLVFSSTT